jgi:hypothetical protein
MMAFLLALLLFSAEHQGVEVKLESATRQIDPAKSLFLTLTVSAPADAKIQLPDLRERVVGFSLAEDFADEPRVENGVSVQVANWRLLCEPCAEVYKIKPFAVGELVVGPVYFDPPDPREPVTGEMEVELKRDFPPLSWKLVGTLALLALGVAAAIWALWRLFRFFARRIKEHRMSPIERAWAELGRLLEKGLPGRGRYKDFYVELTMVVRRYIQRKYGIRAPHMTTEEFLASARPSDELRRFLESADMVKFAGVEATGEMADAATDSARAYLRSDNDEKIGA